MVGTRSGTAYVPKSIHYGRYAKQNATLPGQKKAAKVSQKPKTRQSKRKSSDVPLSASPPPTPPNPANSTVVTRSSHPTCSHFGPLRNQIYPGYFFCQNCKWWDDNVRSGCTGNAKRTSQKFRCRASHDNWLFPSDVVHKVHYKKAVDKKEDSGDTTRRRRRRMMIEDDDEEEDEDYDADTEEENDGNEDSQPNNEPDSDVVMGHTTTTVKNSLEKQVEVLQEKVKVAQQAARRWKQRYTEAVSSRGDRRNPAKYFIHRVQTQEQSIGSLAVKQARAKSIVDSIWDACNNPTNSPQSLNTLIRDRLILKAKKFLRSTVFSPQNLLKAMDMNGGQLSMAGIEVMREMEADGKKWFRDSLIPSSAEIKRACRVVETYATSVVPYKHGHLENGGEFVEWDAEKMIVAILGGFGLIEIAKGRPVKLNHSIDGSQISKNVTHVTYGLKVADKAATCPFKKQPIFANANETTLQSRNNCFPLKIVMARETKEIYKEFSHFFEYFENFSWSAKYMDLCPLEVAMNCDMSAAWKALGVGGAAKRDKQPCHCCAVESEYLATPNAVHCSRWCKQLHQDKPDGWVCYHHDFLSDENLDQMANEMDDVAESISSLVDDMETLVAESELRSDEDPRAPMGNSPSDIESIHFDFEKATQSQRNMYSTKVTHDLLLRQLEVSGNLSVRRSRLQTSMIMEWTYRCLSKGISHGNKRKEKAMLLLINTVPCILHLENRVGLKILTMLLMEGCANVKKQAIFTEFESIDARMKAFLSAIETYSNTVVLGSEDNPSQWACPYDAKEQEIGTICLDNNRTRAIVQQLDPLIDICIDDPERKEEWKQSVKFHCNALELLRKKDDLSDDEIAQFQGNVDDFFQIWIKLHGAEGITNYIHMLGSGHISDYLFHWRNLYTHSQQGWEAFNALLKVFYFRQTGWGGAGNKGTGLKSKVIPIARWISRRAVWMCGTTFEAMKQSLLVVAQDDEDDNVSLDDDATDEQNENGDEYNTIHG